VSGHKLVLLEANGEDDMIVAAAKWSARGKDGPLGGIATTSSSSRPTAVSSFGCTPSTEARRRQAEQGRMTLEAPTCRRAARLLVTLALALGVAPACSVLPVGWTGRQGGLAPWYGPGFYGRRPASGVVYTGTAALTAAHPCRRSAPWCA
jgi:rare lipoprotein A (peptidoglycan hydrolase)